MVTVKIKENSKQARLIIEMLRTFSFVEFQEQPRFNKETEKTISDAKKGIGVSRVKDYKNLINELVK